MDSGFKNILILAAAASLIPIIFAIPGILVSLYTNTWLDSDQKGRNSIFNKTCLIIITISVVLLLANIFFNYEFILNGRDLVGVLLVVHSVYFIRKGYDKIEWEKLSWSDRRYEFKNLPFKEAWNTRYHWGTSTQILIFLSFGLV